MILCAFQFTRPGGRDSSSRARRSRKERFNSRARVGATLSERRGRVQMVVSIHAPGWARLVGDDGVLGALAVSIHAPGWARRDAILAGSIRDGVSIHAPGWARPKLADEQAQTQQVSIHAPGWARPALAGGTAAVMAVSIHAPGWARLDTALQTTYDAWFQFTRPGGRDRTVRRADAPCRRFNSRARVGATRQAFQLQKFYESFNSRARVGATEGRAGRPRASGVSIHAPGWARHALHAWVVEALGVSIHAPGWARRPLRR